VNILLTAFEGKSNSAKVLLDNLSSGLHSEKLYLRNERDISVSQVISKLEENNYSFIFAFGQKPVIKNKIYLETVGRSAEKNETTSYSYSDLAFHLSRAGYPVHISQNAGTSYCNHLYFHILEYISRNRLNTKMLFIHIPYLKNITDISNMAEAINSYLKAQKKPQKISRLQPSS